MNHSYGHRRRIRKRFRQQGLDAFPDYEALELLLLYVARQKDMKPVAKALVERFGSFKEVLDASAEDLEAVDGIGPAAATLIHFVKQAAARYLRQTSRERFSPDSPETLYHYCILSLGAEPNEKFRVICLDSNFCILCERDVAEGTVDQAAVYPRKIIEIALKSRASALVLVHNHPDGNLTPSRFDKSVTQELVSAARLMGITVYDHLIVTRDACFSFRKEGLL